MCIRDRRKGHYILPAEQVETHHMVGALQILELGIGQQPQALGRCLLYTSNIVANAILSLAPAVPGLMAEGATFIASGIIDSRKDEVIAGLEKAGDVYKRQALCGVHDDAGGLCSLCMECLHGGFDLVVVCLLYTSRCV